jgi:phage tail sheath protein FI
LTHGEAFRVVTDDIINSSDSVEQGRLIVQIQIAPSQPLEFMTVFLVRSGTGLLQAAEG